MEAFNSRTIALVPRGITIKPFDFLPAMEVECILVQVVSKNPVPSNLEEFDLLVVSILRNSRDNRLPLVNSSAARQRFKLALRNESE